MSKRIVIVSGGKLEEEFVLSLLTKEENQNIIALTLARAAAIVYGQVLTNEEMISLVDSLFACAAPNYTPDGKVVLATIREEEIEKLFK